MRSNISTGREKAAPKSRLQVARMLLGLFGGLGRRALAGYVRCRVVDLADGFGLDRKSLVLSAVLVFPLLVERILQLFPSLFADNYLPPEQNKNMNNDQSSAAFSSPWSLVP
jgi:hypothetical protein